MLEDLGVGKNKEAREGLPFPNIDSGVLGKVIDWCEQHKNDPEKEEENKDGERKQKQIIKLEGWDEECGRRHYAQFSPL